jgi:hypothetical protein
MAQVETLYERVIYVVTGSRSDRAWGRSWPAASPPGSCGRPKVHGKPDLVALTYQACRDFAAQAVFVVSNKAATWHIVHGIERLRIPAFGPIWDS